MITQRHADTVALGVQKSPYLGEVTVEATVVLVHSALHQEGILGVEYTGNALLCAFYKYAGQFGVHVVPHPLVCLVP